MIVDFHTHIFPPNVIEKRNEFVAEDQTFAALYGDREAQLASAEDLLRSMDQSGIDVSVALGFAWRDEATVRAHNDYLLAAAAASEGRIVAFCSLPLAANSAAIDDEARRCLRLGAPGFGELRPDNLNFDLAGTDGEMLGRLASETGAILLLHASEPVGHAYPGKHGLELELLYQFILQNQNARIVAAHWGGGLPFYSLMPEVSAALGNVSFDSAGTSLLYAPAIYAAVAELAGVGRIIFGSDFPLLKQKRSKQRIEAAELTVAQKEMVLGGNASVLLGLE